LFESTDGGVNFSAVGTTSDLTFSRPATVTTVYYVTAFNSGGESGPSSTATYIAPPATSNLVFTAPTVDKTSVAIGQTIAFTATIKNTGTANYVVTQGSLTLLEPGATRADGPYRWATPAVSAQTIVPGQTINYSGTWTVDSNSSLGTWNAYLAVNDGTSVWLGGPMTSFIVTAAPAPQPPAPPANFRVTGSTGNTIGLQWDVTLDGESVSVFYSEMSLNNFILAGTVRYPRSTFTKSGLKRKRLYYFRANRSNSTGTSAYTATIAARTK